MSSPPRLLVMREVTMSGCIEDSPDSDGQKTLLSVSTLSIIKNQQTSDFCPHAVVLQKIDELWHVHRK